MDAVKRQSKVRLNALGQFALLVAAVVLAGAALNAFAGYNIFNSIPVIDSTLTRGMLVGVGLLTGLHCMSMCGAINIATSTAGQNAQATQATRATQAIQTTQATQTVQTLMEGSGAGAPARVHSGRLRASSFSWAPIFYNGGRLISYTAFGALAGLLGGVVGLDQRVAVVFIVLAALVMLAMSLRMAGVVQFSLPHLPGVALQRRLKNAGPFVVGLINGLMPCGPLQAMQLYALSTGSVVEGALSMALFCIGTMPFMLAIGYAAQVISGKAQAVATKIASAFLFVLALSMLARGLSIAGVSPGAAFSSIRSTDALVATPAGGVQEVSFDLDFDSYANIQVKRGVPVRMMVHVDAGKLTGCNNEIIMREWGVDVPLVPGDNVIEFTPEEEGVFVYSCWMNMITNTVEVV